MYMYMCVMQAGGRALLTEDEIQEGVHEMNHKAEHDRSGKQC